MPPGTAFPPNARAPRGQAGTPRAGARRPAASIGTPGTVKQGQCSPAAGSRAEPPTRGGTHALEIQLALELVLRESVQPLA